MRRWNSLLLVLLVLVRLLLNEMRLRPEQVHHTPAKLPRLDAGLVVAGGGVETMILELADFDFRRRQLLVLLALAPELFFPGFAEFDVVGGVEGRRR